MVSSTSLSRWRGFAQISKNVQKSDKRMTLQLSVQHVLQPTSKKYQFYQRQVQLQFGVYLLLEELQRHGIVITVVQSGNKSLILIDDDNIRYL